MMNTVFTTFKDFITDDVILACLTYLSIILSIYFSYKIHHKKIKYSVARNGEDYIFVFWNAAGRVIFKEDLYYFYAYQNIESKVNVLYTNNERVPLELSEGKVEIPYDIFVNKLFTRYTKKVDYSFDFLDKRKGYIIYISNKQKETCVPAKLLVAGRIRGEKVDSIQQYNKDIFELKNNNKIYSYIVNVLSCISALLSLVASIIEVSNIENIEFTYYHIGIGVVAVVTILVFIYKISLNQMPSDLKKEYKKYLKQYNCKEVLAEIEE